VTSNHDDQTIDAFIATATGFPVSTIAEAAAEQRRRFRLAFGELAQHDDPLEDTGPTPPPRAHECDEDCHPFLRGDEGDDQECSVCGVYHGDPCPHCEGRGFHDGDCPKMQDERAEPIDRDEERAAHGDYLRDQMKDERIDREWTP